MFLQNITIYSDLSIPSLDSVISKDTAVMDDTAKISQLLNRQATAEANLSQQQSEIQECSAPPVCHEFQTARLFLSHFGLLNLDDVLNEGAPNSELIALDSSANDFLKDLKALDGMSPRTCDTVHIFYVKSQQRRVEDIVANSSDGSLSPYFYEFINSLGWSVNVHKHPGWTGNVLTSYKIQENLSSNDSGNSKFDGEHQVLYWADALSEIAFVVPSQLKTDENNTVQPQTYSNYQSCKLFFIIEQNNIL